MRRMRRITCIWYAESGTVCLAGHKETVATHFTARSQALSLHQLRRCSLLLHHIQSCPSLDADPHQLSFGNNFASTPDAGVGWVKSGLWIVADVSVAIAPTLRVLSGPLAAKPWVHRHVDGFSLRARFDF
jgi:hypothetical protein